MTTILNAKINREQNKITVHIDFIYPHSGIMVASYIDYQIYGVHYREHAITRTLLSNGSFYSLESLKTIFLLSQIKDTKFHFKDGNYKKNSIGMESRHQLDSVTYTLPTEPEYVLDFLMAVADYFNNTEADFKQFTADSINNKLITRPTEAVCKDNPEGKESGVDSVDDFVIKTNASIKYLPMTMEGYLAQAPIEVDRSLMMNQLVKKIIDLATSPEYQAVLKTLTTFLKTPGNLVDQFKLENRFNVLYNIPTKDLLDSTISKKDKDALLTQLAAALPATNRSEKLSQFLNGLNALAKKNFFTQFLDKEDAKKMRYNWRFTEWDLLADAEFRLGETGKMELRLEQSEGYKEHYAPGCEYHRALETELNRLFLLAELEVEPGCDFHKNIIFTMKSTANLVGWGLHLNAEYRPPVSSSSKGPGFFVGTQQVPVQCAPNPGLASLEHP